MTSRQWHTLPDPGMCDIYRVMMAVPRYFTPDPGYASLSNILHNGQQVNKLGWFTCCLQTRRQEGPAHQTSHVQCMLHTICWAPYSLSVANQRHEWRNQHTTYVSCPHMLGHATRSHHLVPNCLGTEGIGKHQSTCALETIHTWTYEINISYMHVRVTRNQFNACYLETDWVKRLGYQCPGSHVET